MNQGFKATFTQTTTKRCGGDVFVSNGTLESPLFDVGSDNTYPAYTTCVWVINVPPHEYVSLTFQYMDVRTSQRGDCSADFVELRDGETPDAPLIGRYCNARIPDVVSSRGNRMFVRFRSGAPRERTYWRKGYEPIGRGFRLGFRSHSKSCSATLGMEDGRISDSEVFATSALRLRAPPTDRRLDASMGRLNGPEAWCSQTQRFRTEGEYLQINFKTPTKVTSIATQGHRIRGEPNFVTRYKVQYQNTDDGTFAYYVTRRHALEGRHVTELDGNRHFNVTKVNVLEGGVVAHKLRLVPVDYEAGTYACMCLRVELFGCSLS